MPARAKSRAALPQTGGLIEVVVSDVEFPQYHYNNSVDRPQKVGPDGVFEARADQVELERSSPIIFKKKRGLYPRDPAHARSSWISSQLSEAANSSSPPMVAWMISRLRVCKFRIFSSTVSRVISL